jgi:predicted dehydrogenase
MSGGDRSPTIRIGIAGLGFGRDVQLPAFRDIPGVRVTGLLGSNPVRAARLTQETGVPVLIDVERWLDLGFDAVSVALPPVEMERVCEAAIARGLPVFAEKPLGTCGAAAHALVKSAAGRLTAVDFEYAELETFQVLRAILDQKQIGEVRHVAITWLAESWAHRRGGSSWKLDARQGGGVLNLVVTHLFFMLEVLLQGVDRLTAHLDNRITARIDCGSTPPAEDLAHVTIKHSDGVTSSIVCSNSSPGVLMHRWVVVCDRGTALLENSSSNDVTGFTLTVCGSDGRVLHHCKEPKAAGDGRIPLFRRIAERFVVAVRTGGECRPAFSEAARVADLVDATRLAASSGRCINALC